MLPPPSWSWSRFQAHMRAKFDGADVHVCTAFWFFGLINNILYVIILTAALDLVGPTIPKSTVLLASIIPSLATKLAVPYFIHLIPYSTRIILFAALSTCGMLAVALSPPTADAGSISAKVAGIVLANISSGAGEVNFLALTHFYGPFSLAAWGSGTGAAGLVGAGAYALATNELGLEARAVLLGSAVLPGVMLASFFVLLPRAPLMNARRNGLEEQSLADEEDDNDTRETAGLLDDNNNPERRLPAPSPLQSPSTWLSPALNDLAAKLLRAKSLLLPYMLPLFLVYLAEYTINQAIAPTLLFPLSSSPFTSYRQFYPTYATLYQTGVFLSRSSLALFQIRNLYLPSFLQVLNLAVLAAHAIWPFLGSVWVVFAVVVWEGLLGGLVYVSTYARVREEVVEAEREFSLGAVSVSDAAGIFLAGVLGMGVESGLCEWQVEHGRDWCRRL